MSFQDRTRLTNRGRRNVYIASFDNSFLSRHDKTNITAVNPKKSESVRKCPPPLFGPRMDCVAQIAFQRCCTESAGPRSPPSRPRCAESLGSSDSVQNTNPRCTGNIARFTSSPPLLSVKRTSPLLKPNRLPHRGRILRQ